MDIREIDYVIDYVAEGDQNHSPPPPQRLDRWLAEQWSDLSRARLQKLIESGCVFVNDQICQAKKYTIQPGDHVRVEIPPLQTIDLTPTAMPLEILYEDTEVIVINKPKSLVVHPAPGHPDGTLVNALLAHCQDLSGINGEQRPGIVHRLDKDTTGALVIAKTDRAHQSLQAQIQARIAKRVYLGVVFGRPSQASGTIEAPIGRHPVDRRRMAVVDPSHGRSAITHWHVVEGFGNYTLIQFELDTGRTHQIRVHAAYMHHPIVGDPLYTSSKTAPIKLTGQALHAWKLSFDHPITQERIECVAPWPQEFDRLVRRLHQQRS